MSKELIELGAIIRKRQAAQTLKRLEPELKDIRADYERQIAERDAEIERLRRDGEDRLNALVAEQEENKALKEELVALKGELAASKKNAAAPKQATTRKGRNK
jgi:hypothetical protein